MFVSFGLRCKDPGSGSDKLHRGRLISTYYHLSENAHESLLHLEKISRDVAKATDVEPQHLVIRLRAQKGDRRKLQEWIDENRRLFGNEGLTTRVRVVQNSDGSFDAEITVMVKDDFNDAILGVGEVMTWPREI